ncbi:hypothetical protein RDI58_010120 [Solanum bulbocastanum]|uniref:Disease resistance R13L4/SHOC-2-like LRR domain-containing protein n=1 Tax=Solanum bulbocastanum TaxID=147425 RepID=A0AAN8TNR0_SOLBU
MLREITFLFQNISMMFIASAFKPYISYSYEDWLELLPLVTRSIYLFSRLDSPFAPFIKPLGKFSIHYRNPNYSHTYLRHFNLLRVLAIFNEGVRSPSFPLVITKFFHLRYLQIQFDGDIPKSISELQNLQTLICTSNSFVTLPRNIWMMKNLRCIRLREFSYLPSPICESILNLEDFSGLCSASCTKEVFSGISNLKRLIIREPFLIQHYFPDLELLDMSSLRKLEELKYSNCRNYGFMDISIKSFVLPTSLKRLSLSRCNYFLWEDISSTFLTLPNLEELKLKRYQTSSDEWILNDNDKFKSLKLLLLSGSSLKRWEASSDNFPNLKRLVLQYWYDLQEIPTDFGEIATLESIELHNCSDTAEDSARKIVQEQEEMGNNPLKLYIHKS